MNREQLKQIAKTLNPERYKKMFPNEEKKTTQSSIKLDEYNRINKKPVSLRSEEEKGFMRRYLGYPQQTQAEKDNINRFKRDEKKVFKRFDDSVKNKIKKAVKKDEDRILTIPVQNKLENARQILLETLENSNYVRDIDTDQLILKDDSKINKNFTKKNYIEVERKILEIDGMLERNNKNIKSKSPNKDIGSLINQLYEAVV